MADHLSGFPKQVCGAFSKGLPLGCTFRPLGLLRHDFPRPLDKDRVTAQLPPGNLGYRAEMAAEMVSSRKLCNDRAWYSAGSLSLGFPCRSVFLAYRYRAPEGGLHLYPVCG